MTGTKRDLENIEKLLIKILGELKEIKDSIKTNINAQPVYFIEKKDREEHEEVEISDKPLTKLKDIKEIKGEIRIPIMGKVGTKIKK